MRKLFSTRFLLASLILIAATFVAVGHFAKASAQTASAGSDKSFVIEYYNKTKWRHSGVPSVAFRTGRISRYSDSLDQCGDFAISGLDGHGANSSTPTFPSCSPS